MFSEYVGLGAEFAACEVGFQLRRRLGFDNGHFFNWRASYPPVLLKLLRNRFEGMFASRQVDEHHLWWETPYGFQYHAAETLEEDRAKAAHMIRKFYRPTGPRCYFRKQYQDIDPAILTAIRNELALVSDDFVLVILREEGCVQGFDLPNVEERQLKFFAPLQDTEAADIPGWDSIFCEFPIHAQPPAFRLAG